MQQAIALLTGGAEGAGDAQDPSPAIASERALNRDALVARSRQRRRRSRSNNLTSCPLTSRSVTIPVEVPLSSLGPTCRCARSAPVA
jgi:hypothetical protein